MSQESQESQESQWERRHRERRQRTTSPKRAISPKPATPQIPHRYLMFCRVEDDEADGSWVLTGVDSPEEGDWLARELQRIVRTKLTIGPRLSTRCELVENTAEATKAWADHSVRRKRALAQHGESRR